MKIKAEYDGTENLIAVQKLVVYNEYVYQLIRSSMSPGGAVLEVGAGIGEFAGRFHRDGLTIDCLEPEKAFHPLLAKVSREIYSDIATCPRKYDYIISINVLEHIPDDVAALKQLFGMLKEGGALLLYLPAHPFLFSQMDRRVGHYRRYSADEIIAKLTAAGFLVAEKKMVDFLGLFVSLAYKFLAIGDGTLTSRGMLLYDLLISRPTKLFDRLSGWQIGRNVYLVARK